MYTSLKNKATALSVNKDYQHQPLVHFHDNRSETKKQLRVNQMANLPPIQRQENKTGMPDNLKSGIENLSGMDMSDVKVHYNSTQPAQLQAHAFAQGNQIHIASGQEKHLPHEAWHVVQQKQGRVTPTKQLKGKVNINDDAGLEKEADVMGNKALQMKNINSNSYSSSVTSNVVQRYVIRGDYHVANDFSIAVGSADQNKELYATHAHIGAANQVLREKKGSIELEEGPAVNLHLQNVPALRRATPRVHTADKNDNLRTGVSANLTVRRSVGNRVEMPSECEKGAVSIIGGYLKEDSHLGNNFAFPPSSHEKARIGNMIGKSLALQNRKQGWYNRWERIGELISTAAAAHNRFNSHDDIQHADQFDLVMQHINISNTGLFGHFQANFAVGPGNTYITNTTKAHSITVLQQVIRYLDEQRNQIEHHVMMTSDLTYRNRHNSVLEQQQLQQSLIALYNAHNFPKATINRALQLTNQNARLATYFNNANVANYGNNLTFFAGTRMRNLLQELVGILNANIINLERQKKARVGRGGNQNEVTNPEIGEAYGIIGGGYNYTDHGRWNWHWATVIMKAAQDNVTMEAHASKKQGNETHNYRWDIKMYGQPGHIANRGLTFHDRWKGNGFGSTPVTVVGKAYTPQDHSDNFDDYYITGLTGPQTIIVLNEVATLFGVLNHFADRTQGAAQLLVLDNLHRAEITRITQLAMLVPFVHAKLDVDLNPFNTAIQHLRAGGLDDVARMNEETDLHDAAVDMRAELRSFYQHAKNYQTLQKKKAIAGF
ncbi:MAG: hypothetical protein COA32_10535 [Fluviicola sp.]|nr:MAG: hypothetical protein COA32_10535 [Fluviicola sp.]